MTDSKNQTPAVEQKTETPEVKKPLPLKIKNIEGKALILKGVIDKITFLPNQFGLNHRIEMHGASYYFNSKVEGTCEKLFKVGEIAAFTVRESPNKNNALKPYLIIDQIFYTF